MRLLVAGVLLVALAGCESTQTKSARLERAAQSAKHEKGLEITRDAAGIKIEGTTLLQQDGAAATVVEVENASTKTLVALPIGLQVKDAGGKNVYANDTPGLDASLVQVPALAPGEKLAWVNDQATLTGDGKEVVARVGEGGKPGPKELPEMEISGLKAETDAAGSLSIVGNIKNASTVVQKRLVVFVVARKGGKVVAAGRAIIDALKPAESTHFSAFPIGDPHGAELSAAAPPTVVTP